MPWFRKLPMTIELKDGRTLITLADARALMQSLPASRQRSEAWFYVGALLAATFHGAIGETQDTSPPDAGAAA